MIAIFARASHPNYNNGEWRHHGYVVAIVRCKDEDEVAKVAQKLGHKPGLPEYFKGHESYEQGWYGGIMELVTILDGDELFEPKTGKTWSPVRPLSKKTSIGDNRYAGYYEAKELLDEYEIYDVRLRSEGWMIFCGYKGDEEVWMPLEEFGPNDPKYCKWRLVEVE